MTKEELSEIAISSYQRGCKDTINLIVDNMENIKKYMESTGRHMIEQFLKDLETKQ